MSSYTNIRVIRDEQADDPQHPWYARYDDPETGQTNLDYPLEAETEDEAVAEANRELE